MVWTMTAQFEHSETADAVYIRLRDLPYAYGEDIDHERRIDYAEDGKPMGIELLDVSGGVDLRDLPEADTVARLLTEHAIKVFA